MSTNSPLPAVKPRCVYVLGRPVDHWVFVWGRRAWRWPPLERLACRPPPNRRFPWSVWVINWVACIRVCQGFGLSSFSNVRCLWYNTEIFYVNFPTVFCDKTNIVAMPVPLPRGEIISLCCVVCVCMCVVVSLCCVVCVCVCTLKFCRRPSL